MIFWTERANNSRSTFWGKAMPIRKSKRIKKGPKGVWMSMLTPVKSRLNLLKRSTKPTESKNNLWRSSPSARTVIATMRAKKSSKKSMRRSDIKHSNRVGSYQKESRPNHSHCKHCICKPNSWVKNQPRDMNTINTCSRRRTARENWVLLSWSDIIYMIEKT